MSAPVDASVPTTMRVNLKFIDEEAIAMIVDRGISIADLKAQIMRPTGTAVERQRLIYKGKVMRDHMHLHNYNFMDGDTVHVVVNPPRSTPNTTSLSPAQPSSLPPTPTTRDNTLAVRSTNQEQQPHTHAPRALMAVEFTASPTIQRGRHRSLSREQGANALALQGTRLRQAAERLSRALPSSSSISPYGHASNDFMNAVVSLSRQVASVVETLRPLLAYPAEDLANDPETRHSVADTLNLLEQLEAFVSSVRDAVHNDTATTVVHVMNHDNNPSAMNIMMTLLQAVGSAVRGVTTTTQPAEQVAAGSFSPVPPSTHAPFSDARSSLLGADATPLSALMDVVFQQMQTFYVSAQDAARPLHEMPDEFLEIVHQPLLHVLRTALGFADNDVEPLQLRKRVKAWAKAASRQYDELLTTDVARERGAVEDAGLSTVRHVVLSVARENLEALAGGVTSAIHAP
ncbi:hypothetical protein DYB35_007128 [Aphanomyces astaci]|uniref:Ubiquitin-like domain-containing protein n=1 Tax=Aphanomyces astaci TaxID=112090 RepID=A0A418DXS9_APHAT|nr:hypothetical protein DYB35_007128 [Aphanomyces astaci]